ncbi:MAG: type secretion system protein [Pedosphaera sp.]|nr:type secretion system protein [Pedosphaera sp.]
MKLNNLQRHYKRRQRAFTVIELLVIVVVVAIVAGLLMPQLVGHGHPNRLAMCRNNMRQLAVAWSMYADDNGKKLVPNIQGGAAGGWVKGSLSWKAVDANTNLSNLSEGLLGPYVAKILSIYHCPADKSVADKQGPRVRSCSMNGFVGSSVYAATGQNVLRMPDFRKPSATFIFLDEHPDSINDGFMAVVTSAGETNQWHDLPGSFHVNNGSGLSFADGHAEMHRWTNQTTRLPITKSNAGYPGKPAGPPNGDLLWAIQHAMNPLP